jgi:hypothetical protein
MNEFYYSLGKIIEDTFSMVLVPMSDPFNWVCVAIGIVGLFVWLKMQGSYNKKAQENNEIA